MLSETNLHPINRLRQRQSRIASPLNRADMLGNDRTGMSMHYADIDEMTIRLEDLKPVVRDRNTWNMLPALSVLRPHGIKLSDMVRSDKRQVFWQVYKRLRDNGLTRRQALLYIVQNATSE